MLGLVLVFVFTAGLAGCGGGAGGGGGGGGSSTQGSLGTTPGQYVVTVTGTSGSLTASGMITVTVQ
jgi:hypothetical protein